MTYNIVTNSMIIYEIKKGSRYFKINLGLASTIDKNNTKMFDDRDKFAFYYNNLYRTTIYGQGNVGDMKFYNDVFIKDSLIAIYIGPEFEEFIINFDFSFVKEKGIDSYLGHILKQVEDENKERIKLNENKKIEAKQIGNADLVSLNPGSVRYEDLKAYIAKQNAERYKTNN